MARRILIVAALAALLAASALPPAAQASTRSPRHRPSHRIAQAQRGQMRTIHLQRAAAVRLTPARARVGATTAAEPVAPVNDVVGLYVGSISNISWWSPVLPQLKPAGLGSIRVMLPWAQVEPSRGALVWTDVDAVVSLARQYGLATEFVLSDTPAWAQDGVADERRGPDDLEALTAFTLALSARYRGQLHALQVWNEPNATAFFHPYAGLTLPQSYVRVLAAAWAGVKAGDAAVQVIGGNMDGRYVTDPATQSYAQDDFTAACYAAGAKGLFDVWATHNYPGFPSSRVPEFTFGSWAGDRSVWGVVDTIRSIMDTNGDGDKRLAISEVGWLNQGTAASYSETPSLDTQRRYTVRHIVHALARQAESYQIMFVRDFTGNAKGMFEADFTPRPAFGAVTTLLTTLRDSAYSDALRLGSNNYGYRFVSSTGKTVTVAWTTAGELVDQSGVPAQAATTVQLPLRAGSAYDVVDLAGATVATLEAGAGLTLGNDPVLVVER